MDMCTWGHVDETIGVGLLAPARTLAKRACFLPVCLDTRSDLEMASTQLP